MKTTSVAVASTVASQMSQGLARCRSMLGSTQATCRETLPRHSRSRLAPATFSPHRVRGTHDPHFASDSNFKQPVFACAREANAPPPVMSAPGRPSLLPQKCEGSGAPGNAEACEASWAAGAAARDACEASPFPLRSRKGASRRSTGGDFCSRARASGRGPTPSAPLIRRASARFQPHRVQPLKAAGHCAGGRVPATLPSAG